MMGLIELYGGRIQPLLPIGSVDRAGHIPSPMSPAMAVRGLTASALAAFTRVMQRAKRGRTAVRRFDLTGRPGELGPH